MAKFAAKYDYKEVAKKCCVSSMLTKIAQDLSAYYSLAGDDHAAV